MVLLYKVKKSLILLPVIFPLFTLASANFLTPPDSLPSPAPLTYYYSQTLGIEVDSTYHLGFLEYITGWLGTPYRFGGESREGIDCSAFVSSVFRDVFNIHLNRNSAGMHKEVKHVKKKDLEFGDLVFFKTRKGRISHVGIYIGENRFIHSISCCGVRVDSLESEYYLRTYYSGGRVMSLTAHNIVN